MVISTVGNNTNRTLFHFVFKIIELSWTFCITPTQASDNKSSCWLNIQSS
uniref:Bm13071 n=1 Tax=Brugia malayi TaxID=6279 RepID=A0A1I9G1P4_BRUMA|nr:Bm13071 [Brugia malayi]